MREIYICRNCASPHVERESAPQNCDICFSCSWLIISENIWDLMRLFPSEREAAHQARMFTVRWQKVGAPLASLHARRPQTFA